MTRWFPRLLLITFAFQASVYAIRPMVSYRAIELGAGPAMIGVVASSYAVLSLFFAVPVGRWVDRWGEAPFVMAGLSLVTGSSLWLVWIDSLWALALSQAAMGLGHIMTLLGCQTLIANAAPPGRRDAQFGIFMVVQSLGQLAGPAAAGLLAGSAVGTTPRLSTNVGATVVFACAAGISFIGVLAAASLHWRPAGSGANAGATGATATSRTLPAVWRVVRVPGMPPAMLASLTVMTSIDILAAYLPVYGEANSLSVEIVGLLLAARAAASMASRLLMLPLLAVLGRRRLLVLSMVLPALALAALPRLGLLPTLFVAMVVIGFGLGLGQPITLSWVAGRAAPDVRGTAIGVRLSGNRLGQVVLPAAVGAIAGTAGLGAIFPSLAVLLFISAGFVVRTSMDDEDPSDDVGAGEP